MSQVFEFLLVLGFWQWVGVLTLISMMLCFVCVVFACMCKTLVYLFRRKKVKPEVLFNHVDADSEEEKGK